MFLSSHPSGCGVGKRFQPHKHFLTAHRISSLLTVCCLAKSTWRREVKKALHQATSRLDCAVKRGDEARRQENIWDEKNSPQKSGSLLLDFEWQAAWIVAGQSSSWLFFSGRQGGRGVRRREGVKAMQENAHCDGKVLGGTKEATASLWRCVEQTGPSLSLTPWSGGLATFSFFPLYTPPPLKWIGSPTLPYFFLSRAKWVVLHSC